MTTTEPTRPAGWLVRMTLLWVFVVVLLVTALWLTWDYGMRIVEINQLYAESDYTDPDIDGDLAAIDAKWLVANALVGVFTPLYGAVALLIVLALIVHARGWDVRSRARARAALRHRPAH